MKHPFQKAIGIIEQLHQQGHEAFFVGGCVRDWLLKRAIGDIDIATSASPEDVQRIFSKVIPVGIEHGTVIVRHEGESYEVTTFRVDGQYSDQRHPDSVTFVKSIVEDLKRRDFTMNALAMDHHGLIIDPFNGQSDIKTNLIRTVGDSRKRFSEDALRMIRGLRFSAQLGFTIEQTTLECMIEMKREVAHLAVERIRTEMEKFLSGAFIQTGVSYLDQTGIYKHLPVFKDHPGVFKLMMDLKTPLQSFAQFIALCHFQRSDIPMNTWIREWKASNKTKHEAMALTHALTYYHMHGLDQWFVYHLNDKHIEHFMTLVHILKLNDVTVQEIRQLKQTLQITSKHDLAINGHDLQQLFPELKPGPWLKEMLASIEKNVVMGTLMNHKNELKEWIICHPPDID
nr:CCA tRNA nucleotidyltransferase [Lentibacillus saliphilus]